ncbi:MAG TPA: hypothetical protein VFR84_19110 [Candidatus Angelobacter sp.]|nr:hypothetical protein [Candidatus Angelobacter sp.]
MKESERILRVKEAVERELRKIPGVHAVGIGPKITNGQLTGEIAIHILLPKKKPLAQIPPEHVVPAEIEGIKTDILEIPGFVASTLPDTSTYRPLKGGSQVRAGGGLGSGTLACLARTTANPIQVVALSNHHVLFSGTAKGPSCWGCTSGSDVGQPTVSDVIGTNLRGFANEQIDAAIAVVNDGTQYLAEIQDFGLISSVRSTPITQDELLNIAMQPPPNNKFWVNKRGRTTGLTRGWLGSAQLTGGPVHWPDGSVQREHYVNQILILPEAFTGAPAPPPAGSHPVVQSGDSGSLVLDDSHQAVALLFGDATSDSTSPFFGSAIACHISDVQSQLGIAIETATALNQIRTAATVHAVAPASPSPAPAPSPAPVHPAAAVFGPPPVVVQVEKEIREIPEGRAYLDLLRKHAPEIHYLVNHNRRVATVWHRCGGPKVLQSCLRMLEDRAHAFPVEVGGIPLQACIDRFIKVLQRYGSRVLAADIGRFGPRLACFAGMTYAQIKDSLHAETAQWLASTAR